MSRVLRRSVVVLVILMMSTLSTAGSHAHAVFLSSDPEVGSSLTVFPETITLIFSEELLNLGGSRSNYLEVRSPEGDLIKLSENLVSDEKLIAEVVNSDPTPGSYYVLYRVVSNDGHVVRGDFEFNFLPSSDMDSSDGVSTEVMVEEQERGDRNSVLVLSILIGLVLLSSILIYGASRQAS